MSYVLTKMIDIIEFNPRETIARKQVCKKVPMEYLQPFTRQISGFEEAPYAGGTKFRNNDTIMARITPCLENGKTAFVKGFAENEVVFGSTEYIVMRAIPGASDSVFIYYLATSPSFREVAIKSMVGSSGRQRVQQDVLENLELVLPDCETQVRVGKVLSAFDDKIELNTQINHNLEEQAKAIFKSWFLDFSALDNPDFYSYEGVTCPVGWRVSYLADIADYLNGLAMQKYRPDEGDFGYPVLKIKELRQRMCDKDSERCSFHIKPEYIVHDGDVIFSWSGSLLVDFWCGGECGLNQHLFKVSSTKYDKWFYYSWTQYHLNEFIAIAADKATTMGHIKREHLQSATVLVPPADIYNEIGKLLGPIYEAITRNRIESKMLAQLRDSLLPKLMSGEIDVSEVEV